MRLDSQGFIDTLNVLLLGMMLLRINHLYVEISYISLWGLYLPSLIAVNGLFNSTVSIFVGICCSTPHSGVVATPHGGK